LLLAAALCKAPAPRQFWSGLDQSGWLHRDQLSARYSAAATGKPTTKHSSIRQLLPPPRDRATDAPPRVSPPFSTRLK